MQRTRESISERKENVDVGILTTSMNREKINHATCSNNEWTSNEKKDTSS